MTPDPNPVSANLRKLVLDRIEMIRTTPGMVDYHEPMDNGMDIGFNIGRVAPATPDEKATQVILATSLSAMGRKSRLSLISIRTSLEPNAVRLVQISTEAAIEATADNKAMTDEDLRSLDELLQRADFTQTWSLQVLRDRMENYSDWMYALFDTGFIEQ
jgi:hypothetical protein